MSKTTIEWTDHSINPIRARDVLTGDVGHYCEKVSTGCKHCYASRLQSRFKMPAFPGRGKRRKFTEIDGEIDGGYVRIDAHVEVFFDDDKLWEVLRRRKSTRYFWCDMTDLFGWWVPEIWIDRCFAAMALTPQHTHQVLTKRPERMATYVRDPATLHRLAYHVWWLRRRESDKEELVSMDEIEADLRASWPLPQLWIGTSVENQQQADRRIPELLRCLAAVRFLSCEPLLGPLDHQREPADWIIIGCESGPQRRPMNLEWAESIVEQCRGAGVACFVKQLPIDGRVSHDPAEWPEPLRVRQFPRPADRSVTS